MPATSLVNCSGLRLLVHESFLRERGVIPLAASALLSPAQQDKIMLLAYRLEMPGYQPTDSLDRLLSHDVLIPPSDAVHEQSMIRGTEFYQRQWHSITQCRSAPDGTGISEVRGTLGALSWRIGQMAHLAIRRIGKLRVSCARVPQRPPAPTS